MDSPNVEWFKLLGGIAVLILVWGLLTRGRFASSVPSPELMKPQVEESTISEDGSDERESERDDSDLIDALQSIAGNPEGLNLSDLSEEELQRLVDFLSDELAERQETKEE